MTCFICGASAPVIYIKGHFQLSGISEQRAYCLGCFAPGDFPEEIRQTFQEFEIRAEPTQPAIAEHPRPLPPSMPTRVNICCVCGGGKSTLRGSTLVGNVYENRDYCEPCFSIAIGRIQRQSSLWHPTEGATINIHFQKLGSRWNEKIHGICKNHPHFSPEAHAFVLKAAMSFVKSGITSPLGSRQISARELVNAASLYAVETWGKSAADLLNLWGIKSSSDIGDIVFILAEAGLLDPWEAHARRDFDELPFPDDGEYELTMDEGF